MELGECDYCLREGRKKNLAVVTWLENKSKNKYCPHCLPTVLKDMESTPWVKKYGYTVSYPFK
jgi:hypothetical protein